MILIDKEFQALIPKLSEKEYAQLEANILADGCREPLVVWQFRNENIDRGISSEVVLIDGHNRYEICTKNHIEYEIVEYQFTDRDEAKLWIIKNQFGRRNISDFVRAELALQAEPLIAAKAKERQGCGQGGVLLSANLPEAKSIDTRDELATMANVSARNISKVKHIIETGSTELIDQVRTNHISINAAETIATLPKNEQVEIVARGEKEILQAAKEIRGKKAEKKKQERIDAINQQIEVISKATPTAPQGLFHVISIDPPWPYEEGGDNSYDPDARRAANPYPEMSLEQITDLIIPAADDCVLWLWTTHKFMKHSFDLLQTWGFEDKVILTWAKDRMGLGRWLRSQSEFCIMAVRGSPVINLTNQTTILNAPLREHSRKPDEFYQMVDSLCVGRKLDYFSREKREGWEQFGNDLDKFTDVA